MTQPTVYILTWCGWEERLHGSTLVFETLRTGFPTARVVVVDNASIPSARPVLRQLTEGVGGTYLQLDSQMAHSAWIQDVIACHPSGPIVLCDPDVVFWSDMEGEFPQDGLAGRYIPTFNCPYTKCEVAQRIHTSLVMIADVARLREDLSDVLAKYPITQPFTQTTYKLGGVWRSFDTFGQLYELLPEAMHVFSPAQLDMYDHLFCGSHLNLVASRFPPDVQDYMEVWDSSARTGHLLELRGIWKQQEQIFKTLSA